LVKLERYAEAFLAELQAHEAEHGRPEHLPPLPPEKLRPDRGRSARGATGTGGASDTAGRVWQDGLSDTVCETLALARAGASVDEIAQQRALKPTTVYSHLARGIELGELRLRDALSLSEDALKTIRYALEQIPPDSPMTLKPAFDALNGEYDYGVLRCVRAGMDQV
jgi:ATP-dependent DNA helicase RecQ